MAIDVRPKSVDLSVYAGDTFTFSVSISAGVADNFVWEAQIRASREGTGVPDATFTIQEPTVPGGPAYLTLTAEDSARLAGTAGTMVRRRDAKTGSTTVVQTYSGQWDCQVRHPVDPDPVYTLVQGSITIDLDVTRV